MKYKERGITLIALIVTIIVLLLLAGVSIILMTGQEGILTKANDAKIDKRKSEIKEQIEIAVVGSRLEKDNYGKIDKRVLKNELDKKNIELIVCTDEESGQYGIWSDEEGAELPDLPWTVRKEGYQFEILTNGTVRPLATQNPSGDINGGKGEGDGEQTETTCKITYHANGGILINENNEEVVELTKDVTAGVGIPLAIPSKIAYKFNGWYTDEQIPVELNEEKKYTPTQDINLYAQWEKIKGIVPAIKEMDVASITPNEDTSISSNDNVFESETTKIYIASTDENIVNYPVRIYRFSKDVTVDSGVTLTLGDEDDVATSTENAKRMVIALFEGNLTNNGTITAVASANGYGGPKGMYICCKGTLTNNGTITMTARGAKATGEDVYLYSQDDMWEPTEYVPAIGALAGTGVTMSSNKGSYSITGVAGMAGSTKSTRATGSGGQGGMRQTSNYSSSETVKGGLGTDGTSYSGGSGGGGATQNGSNAGKVAGGNATSNGGTGGKGAYKNSGSDSIAAGGGAGNIGGAYAVSNAKTTNTAILNTMKGTSGTGGLLIIYGENIINNSVISSNGSNGGIGNNENILGDDKSKSSGGGGSGGGSINIFSKNEFTPSESSSITVSGGIGGKGGKSSNTDATIATGGAGGAGTVTIGQIKDDGTYEAYAGQ